MEDIESPDNIKENRHCVESEETAGQRIEQVQKLKEQVRERGLKFEVYLEEKIKNRTEPVV